MSTATDPGVMDRVSGMSDDEREDGEIVDDYEDISDYSIPSCGKSDYSQDLLRAISLSSISDSDGERKRSRKHYLPPRKRRAHTKNDYHRRKRKRRREDLLYGYSFRRRRSRSPSSSANEVDKLDKRTLRQLKEAVRINVSQEMHHNSLRTRLKAMIEPDSQEDEDVETLRTLALLTSKNQTNEDGDIPKDPEKPDDEQSGALDTLNDKELTELRLEALKSAVIKKHIERKKRKEQDSKVVPNENNDKENEKNNIINNSEATNKKPEEVVNKEGQPKDPENVSLEEDVDVMRAMLLASMSTKITSIKIASMQKLPTNKPAVTSTPNPQRIALQSRQRPVNTRSQLITKPLITMPSVKPLIINLNSDTDSDIEKTTVSKGAAANPIDDTVTKFLKMQREQFEAKQKQQSEQAGGREAPPQFTSVGLLSEHKQKEYQLLTQKLQLMATKRKTRRLSQRRRNSEGTGKGKEPPGNLKATLEQLQIQKDGRLQMKGKYKELVPLIKKVNDASEKRKQCEGHIKRLLGQLQEARKELATSHQTFTELTQKLMRAKDTIDLRLTKLAISKKNSGTNTNSTTAMIIPTKAPPKPTVSAVEKPETANATAEPEETPAAPDVVNEEVAPNVDKEIAPNVDKEVAQTVDKENLDELAPIVENEPVPDADKEEPAPSVDKQETTGNVEVVEHMKVVTSVQIKYSDYVSPLDRRNPPIASNPMQMLCPYELFGVCKDQDCNYNHCP